MFGGNVHKVLPVLKKAGITVAFRGQNKSNPLAPGQLSDWYPIESMNGWVKQRIVKGVNSSQKWRNGVSQRREGKTVEQRRKCDSTPCAWVFRVFRVFSESCFFQSVEQSWKSVYKNRRTA